MSIKIAVTFGTKYGHSETHPVFPRITGNHFVVFEGTTADEALERAFSITGGIHAFSYLYESDGDSDADFQRQIADYGYQEFAAGVFTR